MAAGVPFFTGRGPGLPADAKAGVARKTDQLTERTVRSSRAQALLDSPADWRGNQPLFSERHLWQLLAIRTLQAAGWSLLQISTWMRSVTDRDQRLNKVVHVSFVKRGHIDP